MAQNTEDTPEVEEAHIVDHWLHGKCEFNTKVEEETSCYQCVHSLVCNHPMERLCQNYTFGSSDRHPGCPQCIHHYTRWEPKQPIPCFICPLFQVREARGYGYELWSHLNDETVWRIGIVEHYIARSGQIEQYAKEHPDEIPFTPEGSTLEYVPVTKSEYAWWSKQIREGSCHLILFDAQWCEQHKKLLT